MDRIGAAKGKRKKKNTKKRDGGEQKGASKWKTRREDTEIQSKTMQGNCQWELWRGGGNLRIMPVGGCVVEVKQKSKRSTLLLPKLYDCSHMEQPFAAVQANAHGTRRKPGVNTLNGQSTHWTKREVLHQTQRPRMGGRW